MVLNATTGHTTTSTPKGQLRVTMEPMKHALRLCTHPQCRAAGIPTWTFSLRGECAHHYNTMPAQSKKKKNRSLLLTFQPVCRKQAVSFSPFTESTLSSNHCSPLCINNNCGSDPTNRYNQCHVWIYRSPILFAVGSVTLIRETPTVRDVKEESKKLL